MNNLHKLLCCLFVSLFVYATPSLADVVYTSMEQVSSTRIDRNVTQYVYRVNARNTSGAVTGVSATVTSSSANTKIVDGGLAFADIAANGTAQSTDTFSINHDRRFAFDPAALSFVFQFTQVVINDLDGDGIPDTQDDDRDGDGVANAQDAFPNNPAESVDTDSDGIGNNADPDDDNDNVVDTSDAFPLNAAESSDLDHDGIGDNSDPDRDGDGVANAQDAFPNNLTESVDTDSDGIGNNADPDDDNDNVVDASDAFPLNPAESSDLDHDGIGDNGDPDRDGDSVANAQDAFPNNPAESLDTDNDGVGNNADPDDDNDNVVDASDAFPLNPAESSDLDHDGIGDNADPDRDGDGIANADDPNPDVADNIADADHDGIPDAQDPDRDGDGHNNDVDKFPDNSTEYADIDNDGIGNNADPDRDGDGFNNDADLFPNDPLEFADLDHDGIGNNGDPDRDGDNVANISDPYPDDGSRSTLPLVKITSPSSLITVGSTPLRIAGEVDPNTQSLTVNGIPVGFSGGAFTTNVELSEGYNAIVARIVDDKGVSSNASIAVSLDMTPPYVTVESHTEGQIVHDPTIDVTGLVNDIVRGTVEEISANVTVNNIAGVIRNRSYLASDIPLTPGNNVISVRASDQAGNVEIKTFTVVYEPITAQARLEEVSGQNQSAFINSDIQNPLRIRVLNASGQPRSGVDVVFRVIEGDGVVNPSNQNEAQAVIARSDSQGIAETRFRLGSRAGSGNNRVRASAVDYANEVIFNLSALPKPGNKVSVNSGANLRGAVFQQLPAPFVVVVTDEGGNVVAGSQVQFVVEEGGGLFENGTDRITKTTDADGRAAAQLTLGSVTGLDQQRVTAYLLDGATAIPAKAGFTATAFLSGDPGQTSISGIVVDNQDKPIPGVTVRVDGTTRQARANAEGQFKIEQVPVGPVHLVAEGSTATVEGEFPSLSYNIVTVPGVDNPLAAPIYMVKLDVGNAVLAGPQDAVITLPDVPGFKLEIAKDSVTFPGGERQGYVSVTRVNANKIPMLPPNGSQPQLIVTIQPAGTKFDPPAKLTVPNTDGYRPGAQVEMYSYDHDLEEFVSIGMGTVSKDGSIVASNPGVGVIKAGWHAPLPPDDTGDTDNCGNSCDENPPPPNPPQCGASAGNPIDIATGSKYQSEDDFSGPGPYPLTLQRFYNSADDKWRDSLQYSLVERHRISRARPDRGVTVPAFTKIETESGRTLYFQTGRYVSSCMEDEVQTGQASEIVRDFLLAAVGISSAEAAFVGACSFAYEPINTAAILNEQFAPDITLERVTSDASYRFILTLENGDKQYFDANGRIVRKTTPGGYAHTFGYAENRVTVNDGFGNQATITRDATGHITRFELGQTIFQYGWEGSRLLTVTYPDNTTRRYHYEDARYINRLTGITDERGVRYAYYQYDNRGRAIVTEHANEAESFKLTFNADGTVTEHNPLGKETIYHFDEIAGKRRVVSVEGQASASCLAANQGYTYTPEGRIASKTDWNGAVTEYQYNDTGLVTRVAQAIGTAEERATVTQWDQSLYLPTRIIAPNGLTTSLAYDENGRTTQVTAGERIVGFTYDSRGLMTSIDGPRTDVEDISRFSYDDHGNLIRTTSATGLVTNLGNYTDHGLPQTVTDANGIETHLTYNARGWLTERETTGSVTRFQYNAVGLLTRITLPDSRVLNYEYDDARRLRAIQNAAGERTEFTIDTLGNITREEIKSGSGAVVYQHLRLFDELGRLMESVGADGESSRITYDEGGNAIELIDGKNQATRQAFDALRRVTTTTDALNGIARFEYNSNDQVSRVTDQRGLVTRYRYNVYGEVIERISPDTGTTTFVYDAAGNLASKTDARGAIENYSYDAANRLVAINYPSDNSRNISLVYDTFSTDAASPNYGRSRLTQVTDESGTTHYRYDQRGNLQRDSHALTVNGQAVTDAVAYSFDAADKLTAIAYPTGLLVDYAYNAAGQVTGITAHYNVNGATVDQAVVSSVNYKANGPIESLTWGNGLALTREYDLDYQITSQEVGSLQSFTYSYDENGNITAIRDYSAANRNREFSYDALDRLLSEAATDSTTTYQYDAIGNRTRKSQISGANTTTQSLSYGTTSNQLASVNGVSRSYDANGNTLNDGTHTFTYNVRNRMASVDGSTTYRYHANGQRRVKADVNGFTVFSFAQSGVLLSEQKFDTAGRLQESQSHIWLNGEPVGVLYQRYSNGSATEQALHYVHSDYLMTPRLITNAQSQSIWSWRADAFGVGVTTGAFQYALRFPGQYHDGMVGLNYNYFRDYDQSIGRYIQSDPLSLLGGWNTYAYVGGNPNLHTDRYGLWFGLDDAIAAGVGAAVGVLGQGISDIVSGEMSGWESYVASAAGGAVGGETLLYTANPLLAGAAGGLTTNLANQGLEMATGKRSCFSKSQAIADTLLGAATGLIPGPGRLLPGVTGGRGSYSSVSKQVLTKFGRGQINKVSGKTLGKMVVAQTAEGLPGSGAAIAAKPLSDSLGECECKK